MLTNTKLWLKQNSGQRTISTDHVIYNLVRQFLDTYRRNRDMSWIKFCSLTIICLILGTCRENEDDKTIAFVGDSLVARWDLQNSFPTRCTENHGVSRSGLDYIRSREGRFTGKDVIVISGTNDVEHLREGEEEEYAEEYVEAVEKLGGDRVFLFSIFPRRFSTDPIDTNERIKRLNRLIASCVGSNVIYMDVYEMLAKDGSLNMQLSYDGLHLNDFGYEIISNELIKAGL